MSKFFTTKAQSKELLKLGVPANSADCYYGFEGKEIFVRQNKEQKSEKIFEPIYIPERKAPYVCIPCWSVGKLIEIYQQGSRNTTVTISCPPDSVKEMINKIWVLCRENLFNFKNVK